MDSSDEISPGLLLQALERGRNSDETRVSEYEWEVKKREWLAEKGFWVDEIKHNIETNIPKLKSVKHPESESEEDDPLLLELEDHYSQQEVDKVVKEERKNKYADVKPKLRNIITLCRHKSRPRPSSARHKKKTVVSHASKFSIANQVRAPERGDLIHRKIAHKLTRVQLWNYLRQWDMVCTLNAGLIS